MTHMIAFIVPGIPQAQGSKTVVPKYRGGKIVGHTAKESNSSLRAWRERVLRAAYEARKEHEHSGFPGAVFIQAVFTFPRPKEHLGRAGTLRPSAPVYKTSNPDLDKLLRAVFDGCREAGLVRDDAQFVRALAYKLYSSSGEGGAAVTLRATE